MHFGSDFRLIEQNFLVHSQAVALQSHFNETVLKNEAILQLVVSEVLISEIHSCVQFPSSDRVRLPNPRQENK